MYVCLQRNVNCGSEQSPNEAFIESVRTLMSSSSHPPRPPCPPEHLLTADNNLISNSASSAGKSLSTITMFVGLINIRSLTKKDFSVYKLLKDKQFDFLCLTETWQKENDLTYLKKAVPEGYSYICQPRSERRGGGVAVLYRDQWIVSPVNAPTYDSFESKVVQIHVSPPTILATIYRPPKPNKDFLNNFSSLLTFLWTLSPTIILVGDFNIHMDNFSKTLTREFSDMLESFGMQQHVDFSTHRKGHILDLLCCSALTPSNCTASDLPNCDHKLITFNVTLPLSKL